MINFFFLIKLWFLIFFNWKSKRYWKKRSKSSSDWIAFSTSDGRLVMLIETSAVQSEFRPQTISCPLSTVWRTLNAVISKCYNFCDWFTHTHTHTLASTLDVSFLPNHNGRKHQEWRRPWLGYTHYICVCVYTVCVCVPAARNSWIDRFPPSLCVYLFFSSPFFFSLPILAL